MTEASGEKTSCVFNEGRFDLFCILKFHVRLFLWGEKEGFTALKYA
jgi:hypothetical protein